MRRLAWAATALVALSAAVPAAVAEPPVTTPPGLVCHAPGQFVNGWIFTPGRAHNLQICMDGGGHPIGPVR